MPGGIFDYVVAVRKTNASIACLLAVSLTAMALWGPSSPAAADANGDHQVDILDIQMVVGHVLGGPGASAQADVNGDGRVDVLDLQRIVSQATQDVPPEQDTPQDSRPEGVMPSGVCVPIAPVWAKAVAVLVAPEDTGKAARWPRQADLPVPAKTERYLFTLTPHAPPCA